MHFIFDYVTLQLDLSASWLPNKDSRYCYYINGVTPATAPLALRLEEGLNLQIGDIDSKSMTVHIHRGKRAQDRLLPLPVSTLQVLRNYWRQHRNAQLISPTSGRNRKSALVAKYVRCVEEPA